MAQMTAGAALVEAIDRERIEYAFFVPGESLLSVTDALYGHPRIKLVAARHEGGASYMALGYAVASGRPGVCMAQRGPGAANLSLGLHCASQDSTPVVAFVTQIPTTTLGRESHQETDLVTMLKPHAKAVVQILRPERVAELTQSAFRTAQQGRPGVVVVVIPDDVLRPVSEFYLSAGYVPARPGLTDEDADNVMRLLSNSRRPVLMAGGGVQRALAGEDLERFAEMIGAPILAWRQGVIRDGHGCQVGVHGAASAEALAEADLFVVIGNRLNEDASLLHSVPPRGVPWVHIDLLPGSAYAPDAPTLSLAADARRALVALSEAVRRFDVSAALLAERRAWIARWHQASLADSATPPPHRSSPLHPELVARAMTEALPPDAAVSIDIGNFHFWVRRHWRAERNTFYQTSAGSMGSGLSTAIGVQLAQPDRRVVAVAGDGGFMMSLPELETAVRLRLPILSVVFNNSMYGTIRWQQETHYPGRVIGTTYGETDFAATARAFGAYGERVTAADEVLPAFQRALDSGRPAVLEFMTDPNEIFPGVTIDQLRSGVQGT